MIDEREREHRVEQLLRAPSYRVAYKDVDFLSDPRLRATRMELELLKPEIAFERLNVRSTIVVFGGTRIVEPAAAQQQLARARARLADTPDDARRRRAVERAQQLAELARYYDLAREFGHLVSQACKGNGQSEYIICTGGGPGLMEAANQGAFENGAKSIGLNIRLPREQQPNPFISEDLCFQFHYFAMRKFHFILRAKALVVFPGGFGTLDELFDALTLRQTGRMQDIPIIMFGREYWERVLDFHFLAEQGVIDDEDLDLFRYAETAEEAWEMIRRFHRH